MMDTIPQVDVQTVLCSQRQACYTSTQRVCKNITNISLQYFEVNCVNSMQSTDFEFSSPSSNLVPRPHPLFHYLQLLLFCTSNGRNLGRAWERDQYCYYRINVQHVQAHNNLLTTPAMPSLVIQFTQLHASKGTAIGSFLGFSWVQFLIACKKIYCKQSKTRAGGGLRLCMY